MLRQSIALRCTTRWSNSPLYPRRRSRAAALRSLETRLETRATWRTRRTEALTRPRRRASPQRHKELLYSTTCCFVRRAAVRGVLIYIYMYALPPPFHPAGASYFAPNPLLRNPLLLCCFVQSNMLTGVVHALSFPACQPLVRETARTRLIIAIIIIIVIIRIIKAAFCELAFFVSVIGSNYFRCIIRREQRG